MEEEYEVTVNAEDIQGNEETSEEVNVSQEQEEVKGGCCGGCT